MASWICVHRDAWPFGLLVCGFVWHIFFCSLGSDLKFIKSMWNERKTHVFLCSNIMPSIRIVVLKVSLINLSAHPHRWLGDISYTQTHKFTTLNVNDEEDESVVANYNNNNKIWSLFLKSNGRQIMSCRKTAFGWIKSKIVTKCRKEVIFGFVRIMFNFLKRKCVGVKVVYDHTNSCWCKWHSQNSSYGQFKMAEKCQQ